MCFCCCSLIPFLFASQSPSLQFVVAFYCIRVYVDFYLSIDLFVKRLCSDCGQFSVWLLCMYFVLLFKVFLLLLVLSCISIVIKCPVSQFFSLSLSLYPQFDGASQMCMVNISLYSFIQSLCSSYSASLSLCLSLSPSCCIHRYLPINVNRSTLVVYY